MAPSVISDPPALEEDAADEADAEREDKLEDLEAARLLSEDAAADGTAPPRYSVFSKTVYALVPPHTLCP